MDTRANTHVEETSDCFPRYRTLQILELSDGRLLFSSSKPLYFELLVTIMLYLHR